MSKNRLKILFTLITATTALSAVMVSGISASANSAPKLWSGSYSSGVMTSDENCPVVVESELLTFNINEFPERYPDENENYSYGASVTASYNFYNPADYDVQVELAFPFGSLPNYLYDVFGTDDDTANYAVKVNGVSVERNLRHTFKSGNFNAREDILKIVDGYKTDEFFYPDMPVYTYVFDFADIGAGSNNNEAYVSLDIKTENAVNIFSSYGSYEKKRNGLRINFFVENEDEIYIYSLKDKLEITDFQFNFYKNSLQIKKVEGEAELVLFEENNFRQFALSRRDENSAVSESDWYNAVVDYFNHYKDNYGWYDDCRYVYYYLMRWYEYSFFIPAGGRLVNEVTAPLYPDINGYYNPEVYTYEYLLSPAASWASFGELTVVVNTPYYIVGNRQNSFEKTQDGYKFVSQGLPDGELTFQLCASESPEKSTSAWTVFGYLILGVVLFFGVISVLTLLGAGVFGIVVLVKHRKAAK